MQVCSQVLFTIPELCVWLTKKSKNRFMWEVAQADRSTPQVCVPHAISTHVHANLYERGIPHGSANFYEYVRRILCF
eukprot:4388927-Pleurochrysis_carterae.AAC.1